LQNYRRINAFLRKLEAFDAGTMPDGRYYGGLMYCGANPTARFSGSGGNLNLQNLPRDPMFGVNFRYMIKPKEGYKLIVADLSQIEVRTLCWLAKDQKALELIRESEDIYHAFGVLLGLHDPANGQLRDFSKELRQKVKAIVLGCGYGMGPNKFSGFANMPILEAEVSVKTYRERMSSVVKYWRSLDQDMAMAYTLGEPFELELPSGRSMRYGTLKRMKELGGSNRFRYIGKLVRNGQMRDFAVWGGILTENCSQALARDIFSDMMLRVDAAGYPVILHVHDEMVCEVPEEHAEQALADILGIMHTAPSWIPDIPVAADGHILDLYSK
jgi:DNA polymerase